jgi:hypothetical protein
MIAPIPILLSLINAPLNPVANSILGGGSNFGAGYAGSNVAAYDTAMSQMQPLTGLAKDVRSKPEYYYNRKNMSKIVGLIVRLAESATVAKINPNIKGFRRGAIDMLYAKIRETEKVK